LFVASESALELECAGVPLAAVGCLLFFYLLEMVLHFCVERAVVFAERSFQNVDVDGCECSA
jgi:hypothetical protein